MIVLKVDPGMLVPNALTWLPDHCNGTRHPWLHRLRRRLHEDVLRWQAVASRGLDGRGGGRSAAAGRLGPGAHPRQLCGQSPRGEAPRGSGHY